MTTVVLADDHPVVRTGVRSLLESDAGFEVVGEAGNGHEAVQLVEELQPDILVLDLMMEGMNGIEVTRHLSKRSPGTGIVILSMHSNETYVVEALKAGARAYVLKESSSEELVQAVNNAMAGRRYLSASLSERAINRYASTSAGPTNNDDRLTAREREVLPLVAQGLTSSEIARRLLISARTVDVHRGNLTRKLGFKCQADLIRYAIQKSILPH